MIFVTAGTQLPFDRLIKTIDEIASEFTDTHFVAQALESDYKAKNIEVLKFISPTDFNSYIDNAELIISHAGMGTIISALVKQKPIIVMPRLTKYNEHRNEHQLGTSKKMDSLGYVDVVYDEQELIIKFRHMWPKNLKPRNRIGEAASEEIINSINNFIKY
ncbi:MAG: glycosyltransferase family 28 protein [Mucilaginibacter sp.]|jgi:UDP-N-acetylglucosamine transferase subunit ALG13|nr:glycosyltransferase family 28 protein [Mucilaginibacter sp.]